MKSEQTKYKITTTAPEYTLAKGGNERSIREIIMKSISQSEVEDKLISMAIDLGKGEVVYDTDMGGLRDWRNEFGDQIIWQRGDSICRVGNVFLRIGGIYNTREESNSIVNFARDMKKRMGEPSAVDMVVTEAWRKWISRSQSHCQNESIVAAGLESCPVHLGEETGSLKNKAVCLICNKKFSV